MPNYGFKCKKCEIAYDVLTQYDETGKYKDVKCPECASKSKIKLIDLPRAAIFANPEGTDKWNNSHSYRFGHKHEQAEAERRYAEENSHVGRNPYKDDPTSGQKDIDSGEYFGEVK
jgi:putative FmdB family regulatory protein